MSHCKTGPNGSPVLFWQGHGVRENPSVRGRRGWTSGMNLSLLLAAMGSGCRCLSFSESPDLFSAYFQPESPALGGMCCWELPQKETFQGF